MDNAPGGGGPFLRRRRGGRGSGGSAPDARPASFVSHVPLGTGMEILRISLPRWVIRGIILLKGG